jgi:hypothetical protein
VTDKTKNREITTGGQLKGSAQGPVRLSTDVPEVAKLDWDNITAELNLPTAYVTFDSAKVTYADGSEQAFDGANCGVPLRSTIALR